MFDLSALTKALAAANLTQNTPGQYTPPPSPTWKPGDGLLADAKLLPFLPSLSGVTLSPGRMVTGTYHGENQEYDGDVWDGGADLAHFFDKGARGFTASMDYTPTVTGTGDNIQGGWDSKVNLAATQAAWDARQNAAKTANGLDPSKQYTVQHIRNPTSSDGKDFIDVLYEVGADGAAKPIRTGRTGHDDGGGILGTVVPLFLGAVAGGAALTGLGAIGGAGGSGTITGGSGLTAGGASGAGLTATPGAGLTLAGATGTGSGLAAGTGANIIGAGIGASLPAVGASALTSGGQSSLSKLIDVLRTGSKIKDAIGAVTGGGGGSGAGSAGGGNVANPIADWLSQFVSGAAGSLGSAAGKIDPLQLAFANYQMQGAERDRDAASGKANEFADYLKTQIDRTTGLGDKLQGALDGQLGNDNSQQLIDSLKTLGDTHEARSATEYGKLQDTLDQAGNRMDSLYTGLGPAKMYGENDVNSLSQDIYNKKSGAVDRAVKLASSQGFADSLSRGLSDSSQAADTRDNVARRFADTYAGLDANSRSEATNQIGQLSNLQSNQRDARITELTKALSPELQGRIAAYHPDNTALQASQVAAGIDSNKLNSILGALTRTNDSATQAAGGLAKGSADAYASALGGLGQSRARMVEALRPAAQTIINNGTTRAGAAGAGSGSTDAGGVGSIISGAGSLADWLSGLGSDADAGDLTGPGSMLDSFLSSNTAGSVIPSVDNMDVGSWADAFSDWF